MNHTNVSFSWINVCLLTYQLYVHGYSWYTNLSHSVWCILYCIEWIYWMKTKTIFGSRSRSEMCIQCDKQAIGRGVSSSNHYHYCGYVEESKDFYRKWTTLYHGNNVIVVVRMLFGRCWCCEDAFVYCDVYVEHRRLCDTLHCSIHLEILRRKHRTRNNHNTYLASFYAATDSPGENL